MEVLSSVHKKITRIPEIDEHLTVKKDSNKRGSFTGNQKNKKGRENDMNNNQETEKEKEEVVHFPSLIDLKSFKAPQYIIYADRNINGDLIIRDLKGELWVQPLSSVLSKKSEDRLRLRLESSSNSLKSITDGKKKSRSILGNDRLYNENISERSRNSLTNFDINFKRNFDKYLNDVQKLIDYAKNPVFNNDNSTQNISIDLDKEKRKRKALNNNYEHGPSEAQKPQVNGRKPIRVIYQELEMKLDNLRNNDIERENFERKIENVLQTKKIQKLNFNILVNNRKIKKIEEIKKIRNEYIERYNKHILEVLKKEKKILTNKLNKIKQQIDYKDLCTELEKEREKKMVERVNVSKYDLVLKRWLTLCIIGSRMMLIQDALVANLKEFVF